MNRSLKIVAVALTAMLCSLSCNKEKEEGNIISPVIEGLSLETYPQVDGSTSTAPLNTIIACKLLNINYAWVNEFSNTQYVKPDLGKVNTEKLRARIKSSKTHESFVNLINKDADLILSARKMSDDEKALADAEGVSLIETPIALDAFVFILHPQNPVNSLTHKQVQDIYMGRIVNWKEVGGSDVEIRPYVRNANSGSQELMESLVMKGLEIPHFPESSYELMAFTMSGAFEFVELDKDGICYTVYYYKEHIITSTPLKSMAVNGIHPDKTTIGNRTYPYVTEVYAVIRDDLDESSLAHKIYAWLQTEAGKQAIIESGYISY